MNTGRQINAMVLVLFLLVVASGAYALWDDTRAEEGEQEQVELAAERGANTYALNCRLCHGDRGEGGTASGRLPGALPLNTERLQGIESGVFSPDALAKAFRLVENTVICGRVGTSMPTWGQSQGGPLNVEQVRQLAVLVTGGDDPKLWREGGFWELAEEHADELDAEATRHATVQQPDGVFSADETELVVSNAAPFGLGQYIRIEEERLRVEPLQLEVERAVDGTQPAEHEAGTSMAKTEVVGDEDPETGNTLSDPVDAQQTLLPVSGTKRVRIGDTLALDDEQVRVVDIVTGIPTTRQTLAEEIGREPRRLLVSGAEGLEAGAIIRLDGELMRVEDVRDDGEADLELGDDASPSATRISVSDASFFQPDYVIRIGDERLRVIGQVETGQLLGEQIGRAQTTFTVSGTEGLRSGMVIRIAQELLEVVEIEPARVQVERGVADPEGNETQPASHAVGTAILKTGVAEGEEPDTDQTLLEPVGPDDTIFVVSGTSGITEGQVYQLGDELVQVREDGIEAAHVRVERGVNGTSPDKHSARHIIAEGNLLEVERGVEGTQATLHNDGDSILFTELEVEREAQGSKVEDHPKGAELFLGHRLIVQRAAEIENTDPTEAADHANGALVRNFTLAPQPQTNAGEACGRVIVEAPTPSGPTPTPAAGAITIRAIPTIQFDTGTLTVQGDGTVTIHFENQDNGQNHNFAVYTDDSAQEPLTATSQGEFCVGPCTNDVEFEVPEPGTYFFRCDVHPADMTGQFIVAE